MHGSDDGKIEVWQTFRGNEWENKGERMGGGVGDVRVEARAAGEKGFYEGRGGCEFPWPACATVWTAVMRWSG